MATDFWDRQHEKRIQDELDFAKARGFTVAEVGPWWRVYKPSLIADVLPVVDGQRALTQVAMCNTRGDAARVAYALARLEAGQ
jgi:hypothetical protein